MQSAASQTPGAGSPEAELSGPAYAEPRLSARSGSSPYSSPSKSAPGSPATNKDKHDNSFQQLKSTKSAVGTKSAILSKQRERTGEHTLSAPARGRESSISSPSPRVAEGEINAASIKAASPTALLEQGAGVSGELLPKNKEDNAQEMSVSITKANK